MKETWNGKRNALTFVRRKVREENMEGDHVCMQMPRAAR